MNTCCFCFDLKHGSNASATFTLVTRIIGIIVFSILLADVHQLKQDETYGHDSQTVSQFKSDIIQMEDIFYGVGIAVCALVSLFSVMLIIGVQKGIKCLFWPWMIIIGMEIGGGAFLVVKGLTAITYEGVALRVLGELVAISFNSYMLWCVTVYYKSLSATREMPYQHFSSQNCDIPSGNVAPYKIEKDATLAPYKTEKDTTRLV